VISPPSETPTDRGPPFCPLSADALRVGFHWETEFQTADPRTDPFSRSGRLEKFGKLSKSVGKVKKSILHPHAAAADRQKAREAEQEKQRADGDTAGQADESGAVKRTLSDFRRDILYGHRRASAGQTAQKLAQKAVCNDEKFERDIPAPGALASTSDYPPPKEVAPPLSDAPRPRINGPDDL
jgi:hypothetical protein